MDVDNFLQMLNNPSDNETVAEHEFSLSGTSKLELEFQAFKHLARDIQTQLSRLPDFEGSHKNWLASLNDNQLEAILSIFNTIESYAVDSEEDELDFNVACQISWYILDCFWQNGHLIAATNQNSQPNVTMSPETEAIESGCFHLDVAEERLARANNSG